MRRKLVVLVGVLATAPAAAQSRVDQTPESHPAPQLPISPAPTNEVNDAPARQQPAPDLVTPAPEPSPRLVAGAPDSDSLTGHFLPHADAGYRMGFGHIDNASATRDLLAPGLALSIGLGYGVSRNLEIGLDGTYSSLSGGNSCPTCTGRITDAQLYAAYHLVQGTRFDPWVRFGAGITTLRVTDGGRSTQYTGMTLAQVAFGGDWFANKYFGFGPVVSFALSTYFDKPAARSAALAEHLTLGMRITFDLAGR